MYLESAGTYYRGTEQHARKGRFLILVQPPYALNEPAPPIRAIVRSVALRQCGHWMIGSARAWGHKITISGTYGADGLPRTVPWEVYERAENVPPHLVAAWNNGGGHNSAGSEAPAMRAWARSHFKEVKW